MRWESRELCYTAAQVSDDGQHRFGSQPNRPLRRRSFRSWSNRSAISLSLFYYHSIDGYIVVSLNWPIGYYVMLLSWAVCIPTLDIQLSPASTASPIENTRSSSWRFSLSLSLALNFIGWQRKYWNLYSHRSHWLQLEHNGIDGQYGCHHQWCHNYRVCICWPCLNLSIEIAGKSSTNTFLRIS